MEHPGPDSSRNPRVLLAIFENMVREHALRLDLLSPAALDAYQEHMLAPCLAFAGLPLLAGNALRIVDLGSGGGHPAIPLAICRQQHDYLLVDSQLKKCRFLSNVVNALDLPRVEILHARVEKVRGRPAPDVFIAWFFKDPRRIAAWTRHWRQPGTRYFLIAGNEHPAVATVYDLKLQATYPLPAGKVVHEYLAS